MASSDQHVVAQVRRQTNCTGLDSTCLVPNSTNVTLAMWPPRHSALALVFGGKLWIISGVTEPREKTLVDTKSFIHDVWSTGSVAMPASRMPELRVFLLRARVVFGYSLQHVRRCAQAYMRTHTRGDIKLCAKSSVHSTGWHQCLPVSTRMPQHSHVP